MLTNELPSLSIGMAHYDDFNGAVFSIQHQRINGTGAREFLVVDNSAATKPEIHSALNSFMGYTGGKLIDASHLQGTSATRNAVFQHATSDIVICMDCHVLLTPEAENAVRRYFANPANRNNIASGPMLMDHLNPDFAPTQFNPQWSDQMWGRWGVTWVTPNGEKFTVIENMTSGTCEFRGMAGSTELPEAPDFAFPVGLGYSGHEQALSRLGCRPWMATANVDDVTEIPGQGLGCFAMWRENWPGFHPAATGFGGEELCVHELVRQRGGKAECLAGFQWWHRFFRGNHSFAPYPNTSWQKVRNYVLWFNQIGFDLGPIKSHFVNGNPQIMSVDEWDRLVSDPVAYNPSKTPDDNYSSTLPQPPNADRMTLQELQQWTADTPRDLNQHVPLIAQMAGACTSAAEFSGRRESTVALLSCKGTIHSFNSEGNDTLFRTIKRIVADTSTVEYTRKLTTYAYESIAVPVIELPEPVELLFIDTEHHGERITAELNVNAKHVKRAIIIHDTYIYGENGAGGSGMIPAMDAWLEANPDWFVMRHVARQFGLTVLGRDPRDKPAKPVLLSPQGPGTELKAILKDMGIEMSVTCDCNKKMAEMNDLGSAGCKEKLPEIIAAIQEKKAKWGFEQGLAKDGVAEKIALLNKGLRSIEGWKIGLGMLFGGSVDPIETMVKMAISRAEAKGY